MRKLDGEPESAAPPSVYIDVHAISGRESKEAPLVNLYPPSIFIPTYFFEYIKLIFPLPCTKCILAFMYDPEDYDPEDYEEDETENLPAEITPIVDDLAVAVQEPQDLEQGDTPEMVAKKQLPFLNGLMRLNHVSLLRVESLSGLSKVIDNTVKVQEAQRTLLGLGKRNDSAKRLIYTIPD
jgi:hypothetical protein